MQLFLLCYEAFSRASTKQEQSRRLILRHSHSAREDTNKLIGTDDAWLGRRDCFEQY